MKLSAWISTAIAAFGLAALPACDAIKLQTLKPGVSTTLEVRARLGEPRAEYRNEDGSFTWEYNRQPNGIECHMLTFAPDGVLLGIEQVLNEANFARVHTGMSRDEVRRLLGQPASIMLFERQQEEVWDWRIAGTIPLEEAHFHVHFDPADGRVKRTSRRVEQRG